MRGEESQQSGRLSGDAPVDPGQGSGSGSARFVPENPKKGDLKEAGLLFVEVFVVFLAKGRTNP